MQKEQRQYEIKLPEKSWLFEIKLPEEAKQFVTKRPKKAKLYLRLRKELKDLGSNPSRSKTLECL